MARRIFPALALAGGVLLGMADAPVPPALAAMAQTERDFAATCRKVGQRDSFLQYFADDALFFVPDPVNAKELLSKRPSVPFAERQLTWEPRLGDVAASGDLGWLTGPSELLVPKAEEPGPLHQVYTSVWRKTASGDWKVIIDIGVAEPSPAPFAAGFQRFAMPDRYTGRGGRKEATASLAAADAALNERSASKSLAEGYAPALLDSSRLHRDDVHPLVGKSAIVAWLRTQPGRFSASQAKAEAAESGDLGYTYGSYKLEGDKADKPEKPDKPKSGPYVRMWERRADGTWFLALEIE
jgi:ketosteroid isomerase-like protein